MKPRFIFGRHKRVPCSFVTKKCFVRPKTKLKNNIKKKPRFIFGRHRRVPCSFVTTGQWGSWCSSVGVSWSEKSLIRFKLLLYFVILCYILLYFNIFCLWKYIYAIIIRDSMNLRMTGEQCQKWCDTGNCWSRRRRGEWSRALKIFCHWGRRFVGSPQVTVTVDFYEKLTVTVYIPDAPLLWPSCLLTGKIAMEQT